MVTAVIPLAELEDSRLLQCCLDKTPGALNALVKRYMKPVYSYIYHYVQNAELAEDLTQETFIRVTRFLPQFDGTRPFKPWLFTIATNVCKTALKKNKTEALLVNDDGMEINLLENVADMTVADQPVSDDGMRTMVQGALETLSPSVRQALILRHVYDLPYEEVARVMEANINTVRTWLKRGRENMKTILEHQGGLS